MKTIVKYTVFVLLALSLSLGILTGCSKADYRDDLTATQVMDKLLAAVPAENGYRRVSDAFISGSTWGDEYTELLDMTADWHIVVAEDSDTNINEIGVIRVKNPDHADAAAAIVQAYVTAQQLRLPDLLEMYNPDELPKVGNAEVKVCGNYILYTILDSDATDTAQRTFEDTLKVS